MSLSEPLVFSLNKSGTDIRATFDEIVSAEHIHTDTGLCYKDRSYTCDAPKWKRPGQIEFPCTLDGIKLEQEDGGLWVTVDDGKPRWLGPRTLSALRATKDVW